MHLNHFFVCPNIWDFYSILQYLPENVEGLDTVDTWFGFDV